MMPAVEQTRKPGRPKVETPNGWEPWEIAFLREVWGGMKRSEIAEKLERHSKEVSAVAYRIGLRGAGPGVTKTTPRPWTREEEDRLAELFQVETNAAIAKLMGRSKQSVTMKAERMGLLKGPAFHSNTGAAIAYRREKDKLRKRLTGAMREAARLLQIPDQAAALKLLTAAIEDDERRMG